MLQEKITSLQRHLAVQKLDGLVIGNFGHQIADDVLYYLLLKKMEFAMLYIPARGKPHLWATPFEVTQLQKKYPEVTAKPFDRPAADLIKSVSKKSPGKLAIRPSALPAGLRETLAKVDGVELVPFTGEEQLMALKSPTEVRYMQQVCTYTDNAFAALLKNWKKFKCEKDAANFLLVYLGERGLEPSFPTIIASGKNAANPHHETSSEKLKPGFCVIDMGVRYRGYCSDMTRTIYLGRPSERERQLYHHLQTVQEATTGLVKAGVSTRAIDTFCRQKLGEDLNREFIHGLGHGVGTQVHEWPRVGSMVDVELSENMVITIEPGVYRAGKYGIRIEDDVLVTKTKAIILNKTTKQLIVVPRM